MMCNATDSETRTARATYGPFGNIEASEGTLAGDNPYRFSTKYTDAETDLVYYGYRYYDADLGRCLSRDPMEEDGGINLYKYGSNSSVNGFDLLGGT